MRTSDIKKLILNLLNDGMEHNIESIKKYIFDETSMVYEKDYTKGVLAGALHTLEKAEKVVKPSRGIYKIGNSMQADKTGERVEEETNHKKVEKVYEEEKKFTSKRRNLMKLLEQTYGCIENNMKDVRVLDLDSNDLEFTKEILEVMKNIQLICDKYKD